MANDDDAVPILRVVGLGNEVGDLRDLRLVSGEGGVQWERR